MKPRPGSPLPLEGRRCRAAAAAAGLLVLAACQSRPAPDYAEMRSGLDPVSLATHVSENVRACWFGGKRAAFAEYSYAPELNSYSGKPRVLIVPKADPGGLPKLVMEASQAERGSRLKLFGPLMASAEAPAISRDVQRWASGASGC